MIIREEKAFAYDTVNVRESYASVLWFEYCQLIRPPHHHYSWRLDLFSRSQNRPGAWAKPNLNNKVTVDAEYVHLPRLLRNHSD